MIRRPPRSTRKESSAASDVYKRQVEELKKAEEELVDAHKEYVRQNELAKVQEKTLAEKLKDLESNDIDLCIADMEKLMAKQVEMQKKLKEKIAAYKKKQSEEEELSKNPNKK
eukprot:TRINITY_DN13088_c0_g1_i9.p1 TRINITY_DN13088_c0_g1~~TRINITY_DN13088_c0_g1_i9.p1  ORF type:complete len:122 (+),score=67.93 TRINITY_DN13088_c0_g1_i9:30-368(+)